MMPEKRWHRTVGRPQPSRRRSGLHGMTCLHRVRRFGPQRRMPRQRAGLCARAGRGVWNAMVDFNSQGLRLMSAEMALPFQANSQSSAIRRREQETHYYDEAHCVLPMGSVSAAGAAEPETPGRDRPGRTHGKTGGRFPRFSLFSPRISSPQRHRAHREIRNKRPFDYGAFRASAQGDTADGSGRLQS